MSTPILRAGPFASSTDSFLDEPSTASLDTLPVNCAKDTGSSNWPWKCYTSVMGSNNDVNAYLSGFQSISRTKNVGNSIGDINVYTGFSFYVQCTSSITFTVNYNLEANSPIYPFSQAAVYVNMNGFGDSEFVEDDGSGFGVTASLSGSQTITVPKSVVPTLVDIYASAYSGGALDLSSGDVSLALSFS